MNPLLLPALFLLGSLAIASSSASLLQLGKFKSKELFRSKRVFFFRSLFKRFFSKQEWENLYFYLLLSKQLYLSAYAVSAFAALPPFSRDTGELEVPLAIGIIALALFSEYFVRLASIRWSRKALSLSSGLASCYLLPLFPLLSPLIYLARRSIKRGKATEESAAPLTDRSQIKEMLSESDLHPHLGAADQKWITSFLHFKERSAKEIMVPRIHLFSLPAETTIREAARLFASEGYSRIPIYRETLDEISGVVLYKDLLRCFTDPAAHLEAPLTSIAKPVLYTPENKKIAQLLQEFRSKQIHMAIVVDEYGGTEGIVTIEDILEELVGEIEDEYDLRESPLFWELPSGGWIVDAKMNILEIEEQLGIKIPPHPDYETIGGYVFHCAGTIPSKGWRLSCDAFDLEVLSSSERSVKKIKLIPRKREEGA